MPDPSETLPAVLSVEDEPLVQTCYKDMLHGRVRVITAFTVEQGQELFRENPDIRLVIMDGRVPSQDRRTTLDLVREIRACGFAGPMIASSNDHDHREVLLREGCDQSVSFKSDVPKLVLRSLGIVSD